MKPRKRLEANTFNISEIFVDNTTILLSRVPKRHGCLHAIIRSPDRASFGYHSGNSRTNTQEKEEFMNRCLPRRILQEFKNIRGNLR
ncbi:hypothetical protein CDL12_28891 [Handroanthus impetiginosus]|uniref:Uncharacterized protein n=1 Tax=Handroanthus impetiginosus TaxID=429701 RepID=A0A2G9FZX5_9LAMI|nr:hypothetical protein CDL12_28891 [Handroanthus impetiginosus]